MGYLTMKFNHFNGTKIDFKYPFSIAFRCIIKTELIYPETERETTEATAEPHPP